MILLISHGIPRNSQGQTSKFPSSIHPYATNFHPFLLGVSHPSYFLLGKKSQTNQATSVIRLQAWWTCIRLQQLLNEMNPYTSALRTTAPPPRAVPRILEDLTNFMECWPTRSALKKATGENRGRCWNCKIYRGAVVFFVRKNASASILELTRVCNQFTSVSFCLVISRYCNINNLCSLAYFRIKQPNIFCVHVFFLCFYQMVSDLSLFFFTVQKTIGFVVSSWGPPIMGNLSVTYQCHPKVNNPLIRSKIPWGEGGWQPFRFPWTKPTPKTTPLFMAIQPTPPQSTPPQK